MINSLSVQSSQIIFDVNNNFIIILLCIRHSSWDAVKSNVTIPFGF